MSTHKPGSAPAAKRITQRELEAYLWGAAVLLRGLIDAGDYKQFIFPLVFLKRLSDVYDEEHAAGLAAYGDEELADLPENHRFAIPAGAHWNDIRSKNSNVGITVLKAMRAIESANPDTLMGVFGEGDWGNKNLLPDETLRDLVEHFSSKTLTVANLPEDELGNGYEYLIKKFADDSGHTAQEFYTNRTLVHLMTLMLKPEPGESVYDPTCGTGGMLISAAAEVRRQDKEWRNLRLYGQELNHGTSAIARMNLFLHGIIDGDIAHGDTLAAPAFHDSRGGLRTFDVVLANPPYSIKAWNRASFAKDPYGRNAWGVPPQGRADYAFFQHIAKSLDPKTGRAAILFPHGVLFRHEEAALREGLVRSDLLECVLGLGAGLFYNSPMEAVVVILRARKPAERQGKVLFINAVNEVAREQTQSFLREQHQQKILTAYEAFIDQEGFARVATMDQVVTRQYNPRYAPLRRSQCPHGRPAGRYRLCGNSVAGRRGHRQPRDRRRDGTSPGRELAMTLNLEKSTWKRAALGDVVRHITDRVVPETSSIERFLAGEHIPSQSLQIREWGVIGRDPVGPMFYKRFRPGHVLYVSRRSYLRKTAVPDFIGICGEKTFVLETRDPAVLSQAFLPFLLSAERFHTYAVRMSRGSVNPYINWTDLAAYEFDLPPFDEQQRIANLLWTVEHEIRAASQLQLACEVAVRSQRREFMSLGEPAKASEIMEIDIGRQRSPKFQTGLNPVPYLRSANIKRGAVSTVDILTMDFTPGEVERFALVEGDILVTEGCGSPLEIGAPARWTNEIKGPVCFQNTLLRYRPATTDPLWLWQWAQFAFDEGLFREAATGTGILHIGLKRAREMRVRVPDFGTQQRVAALLDSLDKACTQTSWRLERARALADTLNYEVFGAPE
jgi:type I restriction-modification system DNA methylase subunit/restriction endonuclease S subunit